MPSHQHPSADDQPPSGSWWELVGFVFTFVGRHKRQFVMWTVVMVLCQVYSLVPPLIIGNIVDFFLHFKPGHSLTPFYSNVAILGVGTAVAAFVRLQGKDRLGKVDINAVYHARVEGFDRLMRYPLSWHQRENTGNKMQRLQAGLNNLQQLLRVTHDDIPSLLISFVGVLGVFLFLDWVFAVFLLTYTAIFFAIEYYYYQRLQATNHLFNQAVEASSGTYLESANNVLTVKMMGAADALKQNVDRAEVTAKDLAYDSHRLITKKWQHFQIVNAIALAIFLLIVGRSVLAGTMTAGAIFVYFSYFQRLSDSAANGLNTLLNLIQFKVAIERMMPIYSQAPHESGGVDFPEQWQEIVFEEGTFVQQSEGKQFVIEDLNLRIGRGQQVGVVGKSGSGKSTLAKLLLGVYQLSGGRILIGNVPLDQIDPQQLTKRITIVPQETELFNLTLRQNITMMKDVDEAALRKAIDIACLQPVIDKLPHGLESIVGEKGGRLSGGERQRIGIARAICAHTEIIVLDEATSALDSRTELAVQEALESQLPGKTLIIIAHRLMTLRQVDRIVVFDKGRVVEQDAFNRLLTNPASLFAQMYKLQQPAKLIAGTKKFDLSQTKQIYSRV